jgi:hypothetical protein
MTRTRPVGEIFKHPGHHEELIVVEALGCDFCARSGCGCRGELTGPCGANDRSDRRSVQFVTLSKHAQHKLLGDYDAAQRTLEPR